MSERHPLTPGTQAETCLASSYGPDPRRYDELLDAAGVVRPHWRALVERLTAHKPQDAARRALELTRRLIVENGVAYNVYSDPQGADRPWALDPLPLVISRAGLSVLRGEASRGRGLPQRRPRVPSCQVEPSGSIAWCQWAELYLGWRFIGWSRGDSLRHRVVDDSTAARSLSGGRH